MFSVASFPSNIIFGPQPRITQHCSSIFPCISFSWFCYGCSNMICVWFIQGLYPVPTLFLLFSTNTACIDVMKQYISQFNNFIHDYYVYVCSYSSIHMYWLFTMCKTPYAASHSLVCLQFEDNGIIKYGIAALSKYHCMEDSRDLRTGYLKERNWYLKTFLMERSFLQASK